MAVRTDSYKDPGNTTVHIGTSVVRIMQCDDLGDPTAIGVTEDILGNDGTSVYELPEIQDSEFSDTADINEVKNEAGEPVGNTSTDRTVQFTGNIIGQIDSDVWNILLSFHESNPKHRYWIANVFERTQGGYRAIEMLLCNFVPQKSTPRSADGVTVFPFTLKAIKCPLIMSPTMNYNVYYNLSAEVTSIPAIGSETWTNNTP